jgi:hypothetical protein
VRYRNSALACREVMTFNCANPACAVPLQALKEGRLFQFEVRPKTSAEDAKVDRSNLSRKVSHFWLCGPCSSKLILVFDQIRGVVVRPLDA